MNSPLQNHEAKRHQSEISTATNKIVQNNGLKPVRSGLPKSWEFSSDTEGMASVPCDVSTFRTKPLLTFRLFLRPPSCPKRTRLSKTVYVAPLPTTFKAMRGNRQRHFGLLFIFAALNNPHLNHRSKRARSNAGLFHSRSHRKILNQLLSAQLLKYEMASTRRTCFGQLCDRGHSDNRQALSVLADSEG